MANAYESISARNWGNAAPMSALFELTFVCNHACSFCYNCPTGQKEMTTTEVIESFRKLADFNILYLTLSGGEPMVRKDFFELGAAARQMGFAIRIYTNAFLIDEPTARKIKDIVNPLEMEISIHGSRPEAHEKLTCVPGSLQRVIDATRYLRALNIKVNLKCPITRDNQDQVLELQRLADDLDARIQFDPVITPRDDGDKDPLRLMASDDFLEKYWTSDEYARARKEPVPQPRNDGPGEAVCGTGRSSLAIDPYGNIYPCVQWRRKAANIKDLKSLKEMWQTSPVLIDVRKTAVDIAQKVLKEVKNGSQCGFCAGVADLQLGDPTAMYPQVLKNAEFRAKAYEIWKAKNGGSGDDETTGFAKCGM